MYTNDNNISTPSSSLSAGAGAYSWMRHKCSTESGMARQYTINVSAADKQDNDRIVDSGVWLTSVFSYCCFCPVHVQPAATAVRRWRKMTAVAAEFSFFLLLFLWLNSPSTPCCCCWLLHRIVFSTYNETRIMDFYVGQWSMMHVYNMSMSGAVIPIVFVVVFTILLLFPVFLLLLILPVYWWFI